MLNIALSKLQLPRIDSFLDEKVDIFLAADLRPTVLSNHVKKIQVLHDFSWLNYKQFFSNKTKLWFKLLNPKRELLNSNKIITVSKSIQNELKAFSPQSDSEHIPPFINGKFKTNPIKENYFFYIGTLEPRKNIEKMIEGFKILQQKHPKAKLLIAGQANSKVFRNIKKQENSGLKWLGEISEKQKQNHLSKARALIYLSEYEGFGLPLAEAILQQTPCLISIDPALQETAGEAALRCNPHKPKNIAQQMELLLYDQEKYKKLQNACQKEAAKWNNKNTLNKWLNLFQA